MNDNCDELNRILSRPRGLSTVPDVHAFVDSLTGMEGCIVDGLIRAAEAEDWGRFEEYVFVASRHPDKRYTPILCSVLQKRSLKINFEDIVDALDEIAGERGA